MDDVGQQAPWPQRAVVFGASGAIGGALCKQLVEGGTTVLASSRSGAALGGAKGFRFDLMDETSIASIEAELKRTPPDLVIVATGSLTLPGGTEPEKSLKQLSPDAMAQAFALNTIGPAMIAKHFLPIMPRDSRSVFAALSARVGSISDNRLGGWHSYRASKAALNMLIRNFAIEMRRTHERAIIVGLHPGTVDSNLSKPFQANLPDGQLTDPDDAARNLLAVIGKLEPHNSGNVFDWHGREIPA